MSLQPKPALRRQDQDVSDMLANKKARHAGRVSGL